MNKEVDIKKRMGIFARNMWEEFVKFHPPKLLSCLHLNTVSRKLIRKEKRISFSNNMRRPFRMKDLRPVPIDWEIREPDFVGIGAPKTGTSWWYSLLIEHPQIVPHRLFNPKNPVQKELVYFIHFGYKGIDEEQISIYRNAFAAPQGSICGEFTVKYFCYPFSLSYLAQAAPRTKILLILRNPIDRTVSHMNHLLRNRLNCYDFTPEESRMFITYSIYTEAFFHSFYSNALHRLFRYFDRSQILLLQYEKCKADAKQEIARTYRFLNVEDKFMPKMISRPLNKQEYVIPPLTEEERERYAEYFIDDVREVCKIFPEIDLSLWKDFDRNMQ